MSEAEKGDPVIERNRPRLIVRCGNMRTLHVCTTREVMPHSTRVVIRTQRGLEVGEVLCEATPEALSHLQDPPGGQVMRRVSQQDLNELAHLEGRSERDFDTCERVIRELGLEMDLVDVEHIFGGERIVVYYLAEGRIDFRQLVKTLATELQTRVEMRQIGVRDEAKLLADFGDCGKPVCCNTHLYKMPPVSMKMAKVQRATLDPTKISGRCGRLKCCLRYEFDTYEELQRELPPIGAEVVTGNGKGTVLGHEILSQQVLLQTEDNRRIFVASRDILSVTRRARNRPIPDASGAETSARRRSDELESEMNGDTRTPSGAAPSPSVRESADPLEGDQES